MIKSRYFNMGFFAIRSLFILCILSTIYGCAAPILLAAVMSAPLVGGMMDSDVKVTIDQSSMSEDLKNSISKAKRINLIGADQSDIAMADYLDKHSDYEIEVEDPPKGSTLSQKRKFAQKICSRTDKPDIVMFATQGESDLGGKTTLKGMVTGRAMFKIDGEVETLRCRDKSTGRFVAHIDVNSGIYSSDQAKLNQMVGHSAAKALLELAGKPLPAIAK